MFDAHSRCLIIKHLILNIAYLIIHSLPSLSMSQSDLDIAKPGVDVSENITEKHAASDIGPPTFDAKATGRLLRKIDWHLIPFLAVLYLLSFLDRTNIGNARLAGIEKDLGMTGLDYNNALAIFFPFYIVSEIPSNIILKKTKPSFWISTLIITWGVICTLMGIVHNYEGLLAARAFLGLAEGGLFPGVAFVCWISNLEFFG